MACCFFDGDIAVFCNWVSPFCECPSGASSPSGRKTRPPPTASRDGCGISILAALLMALGTSCKQTLCLCVRLTMLGLEQVSRNAALAPAKTEMVSGQTRWSVVLLLGFYVQACVNVGSPMTRLHINRFGLDARVLHGRRALCLVPCRGCRRQR